jgi:aminopeptidase YwaD
VGLGYPQEIPQEGLAGRVALIRRGGEGFTFSEKVSNSARRGAVAAVIYNSRPGPLRGFLIDRSPIPVVGISQTDGELLLDQMSRGEVQVRVWVKAEELPSQNVVAQRRGARAGQGVVVLGAHYDSVPGAPGANDNASGTATLLVLAEELAGRSFPFTLRFIAFGGEELGLLGSQRYVESLGPQERGAIIAMLNMDVVGSPVPLGVTGQGRLAARLREVARRMQLSLETVAGDVSSDHESFLAAGVPAVLLTTPDFSLIHTPQDRLDRIDPRSLENTVTLALAFLEDLAREIEGRPPPSQTRRLLPAGLSRSS